MEETKYDIYTVVSSNGIPWLTRQTTFNHPTEIRMKNCLVELWLNDKIVAVFRGNESIAFKETLTQTEFDEKYKRN